MDMDRLYIDHGKLCFNFRASCLIRFQLLPNIADPMSTVMVW